jgi:hypothetical protein
MLCKKQANLLFNIEGNMKFKTSSVVIMVSMALISCMPAGQIISIRTPTATSTMEATLTPVPSTVTPAPTSTVITERWMVYEQALANKILNGIKGICEWDIIGQRDREVYVWAICQVTNNTTGSAASVPAVLFFGSGGSIEKVQIPGNGTQYGVDIRKMFPQELQEQVFLGPMNVDQMWSHIKLRQKNPEPPLIVISGVTLP